MSSQTEPIHQLLEQAYQALDRGDRITARRLGQQAAALNPNQEEVWLILAAVSSAKASLVYLKRALEINPSSQRARQGIHRAIQRARLGVEASPDRPPRKIITQPIGTKDLVMTRPALLPWAVLLSLVLAGLVIWFGSPTFSLAFTGDPLSIAQIDLDKETRTPTPTATFTPTPTPLPTSTSTPTPSPTPTLVPTETPTETPTEAPTEPPPEAEKPKRKKAKKEAAPQQYAGLPEGVGLGEAWIDVNLSLQTAYAYQGETLVNSFVVSTGTWQYPTVTGTYRIYVKYKYADMSGPGYYLPDVPYTMYFYRGYGLHGTYWHNNFGTPMSHGCVNLTISDAEWMFNFASVGTVVNVHY